MFGIQHLPWFVLAGVLLNLAPGPDSLLVMTRSAMHGWRAGSAAALGICAGTFVHIFAAALGLSALLATSAVAFAVVKYLGAMYLLYIGIKMLFGKPTEDVMPAAAVPEAAPGQHGHRWSYAHLFGQGFLTNVLNPKVALFFVAFVPQFIAPDSPDKALAFVLLGVIFNTTGTLWCHILALLTAFASARLRSSARLGEWLQRAIGAMFVSFGVRLALAQRN
jgi:RhtB (resistance to homoserine/threonine) family protein